MNGEGIIQSLQNTSFVFTLPILFVIGFALAMWKFWYSIIYFITVTFIANYFIFGNNEFFRISLIEIPIFIVVTLAVFVIERGFSKAQEGVRILLACIPFIIMLILIISTYFK